MITAFVVLLTKLPADALHIAGAMGKLQAVDFTPDLQRRYTFWSGMLGGLFLSLSYFGTDQSQVQRYIGGAALREGRLGLMFNAVFKIPMQFSIVLLGAMLFVFYQFQPDTPVFFNQTEWRLHAGGAQGATFKAIEEKYAVLHADQQEKIRAWVAARDHGDVAAESTARSAMIEAQKAANAVRQEARDALKAADPNAQVKDSDYVFITFILTQLPHGVVGLLIAVMFASALSSKAGELNALGTTSTIDLWRHFRPLRRARRSAQCSQREMVHRAVGAVCDWLCAVREFRRESHRRTEHRGLDFLPGAPRRVRRRVLPETRWRLGGFFGGIVGPDSRSCAVLSW